jgi:hypothetical protein
MAFKIIKYKNIQFSGKTEIECPYCFVRNGHFSCQSSTCSYCRKQLPIGDILLNDKKERLLWHIIK